MARSLVTAYRGDRVREMTESACDHNNEALCQGESIAVE